MLQLKKGLRAGPSTPNQCLVAAVKECLTIQNPISTHGMGPQRPYANRRNKHTPMPGVGIGFFVLKIAVDHMKKPKQIAKMKIPKLEKYPSGLRGLP